MAQNSVSISMTKLRNDAFLADEGYKNVGNNGFKKGDEITNNHTGTKFEVIDQKRDNNGFDMTIFKEVGTDNYVLSYRGTEILSYDDHSDNKKAHFNKISEQGRSAKEFTAMSMKEILEENPNAKFTTTGHSKGGRIVQEMAYEFGLEGTAFNPYGAKEVIENLADFDAEKFEQNKDKVLNVKSSTDKFGQLAEDYGNTITIDMGKLLSEVYNKDLSYPRDHYFPDEGTLGIGAHIYDWLHTLFKGHPIAEVIKALKMSKEQLEKFAKNSGIDNISIYDPIALDLNNNGKIDTLSLENGVFFDHNGDKVAFKSSWVSSSDGILVRDIDGDGKITSGAELFGNFTRLKNGELAKNGAEALKDLDDNNDGIIYSNDKAFNEILVWQDFNSNGKAESGELKSLSEHGIKSINLEFLDDNTALDKDNKQILVGSFAINDSDNALASDIDFSVNTVEREMAESAGLIKGTGFVRDLADALVLSANSDNALVDIYNEFASLDEKQKQLKILPKLVNEWAKTSKHYKSINDDESFLQQNKINIVNIRSDVSTSYVNSLKSNDKVAINQELENTNNANIQSLTPSGLNKLLNQRNIDQDLLKQVLELKDKYSVLQAFSGKDIQTLYYDSNEDLLNIKANITKSYQAILDYTYKSSLMQTRLKEYANDLKLLVDTNMQDDSLKTLIDYSDALNKLENKAKDNLKEAFIDLIEFSDVFDDLSSLKQANDLVSKLINQAIDNNEIYYVLDLLDNNDILVNNLKDVLITKTINNENIYDLDAITSKLNVNIITNKDENNKLQGSNKDDIIISSKTNEDLVGNGGNDVYVFSKDWGKDIVYSYHNNKQSISLRFNDIKLNEIELSTNKNNDLIITDIANSNNEIFIQNALYDGEYKIDKIMLEDISLEFEEIKLLAYNKIEQGV